MEQCRGGGSGGVDVGWSSAEKGEVQKRSKC